MTQLDLFSGLAKDGSAPGPARWSAVELATRLGQPFPPTAEQSRAIEHLDGGGRLAPCLVIAGAGSGKTETMAARVVWLVANRLVRPERILGLTFTRKAAGELAERIRRRLAQVQAGLLPPRESEDWLAGEPVVATYHAYAADVFGEHAPRIGREPAARLLGEAATWLYAGRVVDLHDGDMSAVDWSPVTVVGAVRALAADLAEHLVSAEDVRRATEQLVDRITATPRAPGQRTKRALYRDTETFLEVLRRRLQLLPLVEAYARRKHDTDSLDYGDQIALAARIARAHPLVGAAERQRYDVVLLDEYQDTGTAQRIMLGALFGGGHPVTAVGDPCQSIYGWRGASAGNLARFVTDFPHRSGRPCDRVDLTTSFRNGGRILAVANRLSGPLRAGGVPVRDLRPGPKGVDSGQVTYACHRDAHAEADWVADQVAELVRAESTVRGQRPPRYATGDIAVLARTRAQFDLLEHALRRRGLPVEVSGIGGLLSTPEVADVVATLAALVDPGAGPSILRLLTGARWRLGPRDLEALGRRARILARVPERGQSEVASDGTDIDPDEADARSLVEALDDLGPVDAYSPQGYHRLRQLRDELRALRSRADQALPDLISDVIRTSRLDVEVAARPSDDADSARAHLDRFLDVAAEFADSEESPTTQAFLAYLAAAAEHERGLDTGRVGVQGDAVQLLTIHGAKGLEWPVVILPGMTRDVFPGRPRESGDWCANAKLLPFSLRGDASDLPALDLLACRDQVAVRDALAAHKAACADRAALEERRLLYVGVTRAQDLLICSGYWWDHTTKPRGPSHFLEEVRQACEELAVGANAAWARSPEADDPNPLDRTPRQIAWPVDPLPPERRSSFEEGRALVEAAIAADLTGSAVPVPLQASACRASAASDEALSADDLSAEDRERVDGWSDEVAKLVGEQARMQQRAGVVEVTLPTHLSVSALVALRRDPDALARSLRRPMPLRPAPLARRGTAFHVWLEQRFAGGRLLDLDELPGSADADAAGDEDLTMLKERFLASSWAHRQPVPGGVEVPFETAVEGVLLRGRMDAVFRCPDGTWDVVDWKTGRPLTGAEAEAAAVQLASYRLAWHRLTGAPLHSVRAAFHYVRTGDTVRPVDLLDGDGLAALIRTIPIGEQ